MEKEDAAKIIALALAEKGGHSVPTIIDWGEAKYLANLIEERGHLESHEPNTIGYAVVGRDGDVIKTYAISHKQVAEKFAAESSEDCKDSLIDWDYRVVAIIEVN